LITQVAFPEEVIREVYAQGEYAKHGLADTSNADDHVFEGSLANELATVTGSVANGYALTHSIYVKG
jgi:hypothetical protein